MKLSKSVLLASLLVTTTLTFAENYFLINGKKIGLQESQKSIITKLGKPKFVDGGGSLNWGNYDDPEITAYFNQYGLDMLSTSKGSVVINGKMITIAKDSPNTSKSKVQNYCEGFDGGNSFRQYNQSTRVGAEGEIYISFGTYGDRNTSNKTLMSKPIESISLGYEDPLANFSSPKCNY